MSNEILNIGVTGMVAQGKNMAVIGNNIANNRTVGYKRGSMSFAEAYYPPGAQMANGVFNQRGQGVTSTGVTYDWNTGPIEETGNMTHVALVGDGFMPVNYNGQLMYTRCGDFSFYEQLAAIAGPPAVAGEYVMMRPNGAKLVDSAGAVLTFAAIPVDMEIDVNGNLTATLADGSTANAALGLQRFANPDTLEHVEGGLYRMSGRTVMTSPALESPGTNGCAYVRQGSLEQANVDLVQEFADMIACQRAFQANSRTITTADSMIQEILQMKR